MRENPKALFLTGFGGLSGVRGGRAVINGVGGAGLLAGGGVLSKWATCPMVAPTDLYGKKIWIADGLLSK